MGLERRIVKSDFSVRQNVSGQNFIEGYASVFNQKSKLITEDGKTFYEIINPRAFDELLADPELNVIANRDHDDTKILARTRSGTLTLSVDDYGLKYSFIAPDTSLGRDTVVLLDRGDLFESSFKYWVRANDIKWSRDVDGTLIREVMKVSGLRDVAIVIDGAFANTDVGVTARDLQECEDELCRAENLDNYFNNIKRDFYGTEN